MASTVPALKGGHCSSDIAKSQQGKEALGKNAGSVSPAKHEAAPRCAAACMGIATLITKKRQRVACLRCAHVPLEHLRSENEIHAPDVCQCDHVILLPGLEIGYMNPGGSAPVEGVMVEQQ